MINLFFCVVFLCVSKEVEFDRELVNELEDIFGYDSIASEFLYYMLLFLFFESFVLFFFE